AAAGGRTAAAGVERVGRLVRDVALDALLELRDAALDVLLDLGLDRLLRVVLLQREEALVEEQGLLAVARLAVGLRDVEEEGGLGPLLVGLGEQLDRLVELTQVVGLLAVVVELLRLGRIGLGDGEGARKRQRRERSGARDEPPAQVSGHDYPLVLSID